MEYQSSKTHTGTGQEASEKKDVEADLHRIFQTAGPKREKWPCVHGGHVGLLIFLLFNCMPTDRGQNGSLHYCPVHPGSRSTTAVRCGRRKARRDSRGTKDRRGRPSRESRMYRWDRDKNTPTTAPLLRTRNQNPTRASTAPKYARIVVYRNYA